MCLVAVLSVACAPKSPKEAAPVVPITPAAPAVEWRRITLGDTGVSFEMPAANAVTTPQKDVLNAESRLVPPGIVFIANVNLGALAYGSSARVVYGDNPAPHVLDGVYGNQRASGATVTETFRGPFAEDPEARGWTSEQSGVTARYLSFAQGDDLVMISATSKSEDFKGTAKAAIDRYFNSVRVVYSAASYAREAPTK